MCPWLHGSLASMPYVYVYWLYMVKWLNCSIWLNWLICLYCVQAKAGKRWRTAGALEL